MLHGLDRKVTFGSVPTRYAGRSEKCCLVFLPDADGMMMNIGDTLRCARDVEACRRTLRNLAESIGSNADHAAGFAQIMHVHCKALTKWVEKPQRDVQPRQLSSRRRYMGNRGG